MSGNEFTPLIALPKLIAWAGKVPKPSPSVAAAPTGPLAKRFSKDCLRCQPFALFRVCFVAEDCTMVEIFEKDDRLPVGQRDENAEYFALILMTLPDDSSS
jgi:hypothetical protein